MKPAVFLDRDGVINRDVKSYVRGLDQLRLFPYTVSSLKQLHDAGHNLYVISNQQGVGRGLVSQAALDEITEAIQNALRPEGFEIKQFYYCTSLVEENDPRRKPGNGMLLEARDEFGIDLESSYFIGDSADDMEAGAVSGCRTILLLSGVTVTMSETKRWKYPPNEVFRTLVEASEFIVSR